jgi:pectate lyase
MGQVFDQAGGLRGVLRAAVAAVSLGGSAALAGPTLAAADGFGANVTGGGGVGDVYHVTTLDSDPTGVIPGSLRYGLYYKNMSTASSVYGKRTIVFDVGGTIDLGAGTLDIKDVSNVTIAGQTAPSPVVIHGNTTQITGTKTNNIIFQYVTIRNPANGEDSLSIKGTGPTTNILADHISTSWGKDEQISVTQGANNVTVQNSFATEALDSASHAYGSLIRPEKTASVSYLKNLYANNRSRNPRPGSYNQVALNFEFRNNVVYNYSDRAGYTGGEGHDIVNMNYVGNYIIAGPYTTQAASATAFTVDNSGDGVDLVAYQSGNVVDANGWGATLPGLKNTTSAGKVTYGKNTVRDGTDLGWGAFTQLTGGTGGFFTQSATPAVSPTLKYQADALTAYQQVLAGGGNFAWNRDATDARLVAQVKAGIGDVMNAAPAGELAAVQANINAANWTRRDAGYDTDNDGLPSAWELQHGLNPSSATTQLHYNATTQKVTTANSGFEGWTGGEANVVSPNGYTWLEVYLAELGLQATYAGGNWDDILGWNGVLPDAQGATARFSGATTATAVGLSTNRTVGQLSFDGSGGYTINGSGGVTMNVVQGYATVNAAAGTHTLNVPLSLANDTRINVAGGATLGLMGGLNTGNRTLTKEGAGTLMTTRTSFAVLLGNTGGADLKDGSLVVNYTGGQSQAAQVKQILDAGYASHFATGQIRSTGLAANRTIGYGDDGTGTLTLRITLPGDADLNGVVDFNDFLKLQNNFGNASTRFDQGNFDYNAQTDFNDFLVLQNNFGQSLTGAAVTVTAAQVAAMTAFAQAVPEPASMAMLGVMGGRLLCRRRV